MCGLLRHGLLVFFYETSGSVTTWEKKQLHGLEFVIRQSIEIVFIPAVVNLIGHWAFRVLEHF